MIPQGKYKAQAVQVDGQHGRTWAEFGQSEKGSEFVSIAFRVTDGPHEGERLTWRGFFTEKTQERTIQALRYCGLKGDDVMLAMEQPLNQDVEIEVKYEEFKGKTIPRVAWVNAIGAPVKAEELASRLRGLLRSTPEHTPAPPAPAEDDVRF